MVVENGSDGFESNQQLTDISYQLSVIGYRKFID